MSEATSEAAEVVLRERRPHCDTDARTKKGAAENKTENTPAVETVSVPKWDGAEAGEVDESELDRRGPTPTRPTAAVSAR